MKTIFGVALLSTSLQALKLNASTQWEPTYDAYQQYAPVPEQATAEANFYPVEEEMYYHPEPQNYLHDPATP